MISNLQWLAISRAGSTLLFIPTTERKIYLPMPYCITTPVPVRAEPRAFQNNISRESLTPQLPILNKKWRCEVIQVGQAYTFRQRKLRDMSLYATLNNNITEFGLNANDWPVVCTESPGLRILFGGAWKPMRNMINTNPTAQNEVKVLLNVTNKSNWAVLQAYFFIASQQCSSITQSCCTRKSFNKSSTRN